MNAPFGFEFEIHNPSISSTIIMDLLDTMCHHGELSQEELNLLKEYFNHEVTINEASELLKYLQANLVTRKVIKL